MTTFTHTRRIEIDAPDARAAFALERRLAHLRPTALGTGDRWVVELEDTDDRLDEVEAAVRHWLADLELGETTVRVDGAARTLEAPS